MLTKVNARNLGKIIGGVREPIEILDDMLKLCEKYGYDRAITSLLYCPPGPYEIVIHVPFIIKKYVCVSDKHYPEFVQIISDCEEYLKAA